MINLGGGPWRLTGLNDPVQFDAQANGQPQSVGWTAPGSQVAFLALDRNGNGIIDDGSELFGNATRLPDGTIAKNGFAVLEQYDSNNDGVIDAHDKIWPKLLLWIDRDHDGFSQPDELIPISKSPITALELDHHWSGRTDRFGNRFGYEAVLHRGNLRQAYYDVYLTEQRTEATNQTSSPTLTAKRGRSIISRSTKPHEFPNSSDELIGNAGCGFRDMWRAWLQLW